MTGYQLETLFLAWRARQHWIGCDDDFSSAINRWARATGFDHADLRYSPNRDTEEIGTLRARLRRARARYDLAEQARKACGAGFDLLAVWPAERVLCDVCVDASCMLCDDNGTVPA